VEEMRIGASSRDRRIGSVAFAVSLVIAVAFGLWTWLAGDPWTAKDSRPLVALTGSMIFVASLYMSYLCFEYSTLSISHLRTWTPLKRRSIPWTEIATLELHSRTGRGTVWMVRAQLTTGRSLVVPGTQCGSDHEAASAKLKTINEFRAHCSMGPPAPDSQPR
jgi:hypothetical protein